MRNQEQLQKILEEAIKTKTINMNIIDNMKLSEEQLEGIIIFLSEHGINDISDEMVVENDNAYYSSDSLNMYLNEIGKYKLLTKEEEVKLFQEYNQGDISAKNKLINSNLRLVVKPAKTFFNTSNRSASIDLLDLIQSGNMGLMTAIEKFDVSKGYKFSTYAIWWIKQAIKRDINENKSAIRIPEHMIYFIRKLRKFENEFLVKNRRMPEIKEYMVALNQTEDNIKLALEADKDLLSFEEPVIDEDLTIGSSVFDEKNDYIDADNRMLIEQILDISTPKLTSNEINILILRYGLYGNHTHTLEEIGRIYKLSRERVRQIEKRILKKIKLSLKQNNFVGKTI